MLHELDSLLNRVTSMAQIHGYLPQFFQMIEEPVCSTAILMWLKNKLFDDDFYECNYQYLLRDFF